MNRTTFFAYARKAPFGNRLSQAQIDGLSIILDACQAANVSAPDHVAYILATAFHETGGRMQPVRETFATSDAQAIARLDAAWKAGKLPQVLAPYWRKDKDGKAWFGRGYVQITHKINYLKFGLADDPTKALDPQTAAHVLVTGMAEGLFTGRKLSDYFDPPVNDPVSARRIINGTDKAKLIASYYRAFLDAIDAAATVRSPSDVSKDDAKPDDKPPTKSVTAAVVTAGPAVATAIVPAVTGIDNVYALILMLVLVAIAGVAAWAFFTGRLSVIRSKAI